MLLFSNIRICFFNRGFQIVQDLDQVQVLQLVQVRSGLQLVQDQDQVQVQVPVQTVPTMVPFLRRFRFIFEFRFWDLHIDIFFKPLYYIIYKIIFKFDLFKKINIKVCIIKWGTVKEKFLNLK